MGESMGESVMSNVVTVNDQPSPQYKPGVDYDDCFTSNCLSMTSAHVHPSFLKTLALEHSGSIFGAIAQLVDNSRDAKATKLRITMEDVKKTIGGRDSYPMLSFIDDGHGMTYEQVLRMMSFGCKQPDADDPDRIGRFGLGFKSGAMRLGKDALVLTQTTDSVTVAFLSQTLNEGKENIEIPILTFSRMGKDMFESAQSETVEEYNLRAITENSKFNEYVIGAKSTLFEEGTGTQIYIWNLDECGSKYCLDWENGTSEGSLFHQDDIIIRSRRNHSRPSQIGPKVPIDFSLRSYLEVIYLDPHMKLFVQGSQVKSQPLAESLNNIIVGNGNILGKPVQLTIGRSQSDWELGNCGMFLYWHGRLIEAYKRVGEMVHNMDKSRGVVGVIDVTDLMNGSNGHVWVNRNKQGFQDCEAYDLLEEWLGQKADEYLNNSIDKIELNITVLQKRGGSLYKSSYESDQCDRCKKQKILTSDF